LELPNEDSDRASGEWENVVPPFAEPTPGCSEGRVLDLETDASARSRNGEDAATALQLRLGSEVVGDVAHEDSEAADDFQLVSSRPSRPPSVGDRKAALGW
jgi:hypothetical protein